jgi:hypothetical protein
MWCCWSKPRKEVELPRYESEAEQVRHGRKMSNHYTVYYPPHAPRKNSNIYNKTHAQMKTQPCFVCGRTNADGIHVETHHYYCAKAFQNAYDWKKFGQFAQTCYTPQGLRLGPLFDWDEVAADPDMFVDSPHNMIVLCKEHHTSGGKGIHHVPFPDWIAQKFAKEGMQVLG